MLSTGKMLSMAHQFDRYYSQVIGTVAEKFQISRIELDVLLFLHNNPEYDTARDIVEYRFLTKSYISKAVELLSRRGFLEVQEDAADRRILRLKILPAAGNVLTEAVSAQTGVQSVLHAGLTPAEKRAMDTAFLKMSENIKKELQKKELQQPLK